MVPRYLREKGSQIPEFSSEFYHRKMAESYQSKQHNIFECSAQIVQILQLGFSRHEVIGTA